MTKVASKPISVKEFLNVEVEENCLYELIGGEVVKRGGNSASHQLISGQLLINLHSWIEKKNLGELLPGPLDVFFDEYNVVQPDLLFVSEKNKEIITENGVEGAPDLVVEILSPGSMRFDRGVKMKLYKNHKVQEYWIVDPKNQSVEPLLGNGICGYFIDNENNWSAWSYNNGTASIESVPKTTVSIEHYQLQDGKKSIAVLTGHETASSGEIMVVAFRGKANTKSFGHRTHGLSTGNGSYELSDGSMILLTNSVYADRNRNLYGGKIEPDYVVESSHNTTQSIDDIVVNKATDWILLSFH